MKRCPKCLETKGPDSYNKNCRKNDGLEVYCKPCYREYRINLYNVPKNKAAIIARSSANYYNNRDSVLEKSKARYSKNSDAIKERRKGYKNYNVITDRAKYKCRYTLGNAVRSGAVIRPSNCEQCGIECTPQGHHHDYSLPLDVVWLCVGCHGVAHRKEEAPL